MTWRGLRCQVMIDGGAPGLLIDIRQKAGDATTSIAANTQPVAGDGSARVLIGDDAFEETSAIIVVIDGNGNVIAQRATIVGEG
jgi:hypothetical protein